MNFQEFSSRIANIDYEKLKSEARICRGDILTMTTLAASGHPGGSMSTIDALLTVYHIANINKFNLHDLSRDRVILLYIQALHVLVYYHRKNILLILEKQAVCTKGILNALFPVWNGLLVT